MNNRTAWTGPSRSAGWSASSSATCAAGSRASKTAALLPQQRVQRLRDRDLVVEWGLCEHLAHDRNDQGNLGREPGH